MKPLIAVSDASSAALKLSSKADAMSVNTNANAIIAKLARAILMI
jgi:hypothetical protein